MTQEKERREDVTAGNILIAEYCGFKKKAHVGITHYKIPNKMWLNSDASDGGVYVAATNLLFHKEWDWIMPIVRQIEDAPRSENIPHFIITKDRCTILIYDSLVMSVSNTEKDIEIRSTNTIENVWLAVIDFIKFYNKTNQQ